MAPTSWALRTPGGAIVEASFMIAAVMRQGRRPIASAPHVQSKSGVVPISEDRDLEAHATKMTMADMGDL